jgi:hypothetical protein
MIDEVEETAVAAPVIETEAESASESETDTVAAPVSEANNPDAVQKRINKFIKQREDKAREAEYWKQEALKRNAPVVEAPKPVVAVVDDGPKEEDFETAAAYVKAVAAHAVKTDREARQKADEEAARASAEAALSEKIRTDLQTFRTSHPDFDDLMEEAQFNTSNFLDREIRESEVGGPALLYHFAKNPEDANRIAKLTDPRAVAKEVAKIEVRLSSAPAGTSQAPTTTTPQPLRPIAASRQAVSQIGQVDDDAEYFRQRRAERTGKR